MFWFAHDGGTLKSAIGKSKTGWDDMGVRRTAYRPSCTCVPNNQRQPVQVEAGPFVLSGTARTQVEERCHSSTEVKWR